MNIDLKLLTQNDWQNLYNEFKSIRKLAKYLNTWPKIIKRYLIKYNIKFAGPNKALDLDKSLLEKLYKKHQSFRKIALELGCSALAVRKYIKKYNIPYNKQKINTCNHSFFLQNNENSFYLAGFIAADGCVHGKKDKINTLTITLHIKDIELLKLIKKNLNSSAKIYKLNKKATLNITSEKICNNLQKFNIIPRKTKIYTFPNWLINHKYVNHFMRGYFDGDGSVYHIKKPRYMIKTGVGICGTKEFLQIYRKILENKCNFTKNEKPIRENKNIGILEYCGNLKCGTIGIFLYKNATLYLKRKKDKFNFAINRLLSKSQ